MSNAEHETAAPVRPGDILAGKYRVDRVLGIGGMGVVVAATHLVLEERVALKFLLPSITKHPEAVKRFLREAKAVVKIRSEHVARVSDVGTLENGAPFIVMEFLDGMDLGARLERHGPFAVSDAVDAVLQACEALAEAHALGIVHRDLKPANLFATRRADGSTLIKVLDFGIAKMNDATAPTGGLTQVAAMMGSALYMSPEQMQSAKDVDARADMWALGVVLFELLTGSQPFNADTLPQLVMQVMTVPAVPITRLRPDVPPRLAAAIDALLQKDRTQRCPNVATLAEMIGRFGGPRAAQSVATIRSIVGGDAAPPTTQRMEQDPGIVVAATQVAALPSNARPVAHTTGGLSSVAVVIPPPAEVGAVPMKRSLAMPIAAVLLVLGAAAGAVMLTKSPAPGNTFQSAGAGVGEEPRTTLARPKVEPVPEPTPSPPTTEPTTTTTPPQTTTAPAQKPTAAPKPMAAPKPTVSKPAPTSPSNAVKPSSSTTAPPKTNIW